MRFLRASMSLKVIVMSSKFVISPCRHYVLFCRNQISCQAHPMIIHKFRSCQSNDADKINEDIVKQGNEVRQLRSNKAGKSEVDSAVKLLLELKGKYKESTGNDFCTHQHSSVVHIRIPIRNGSLGHPASKCMHSATAMPQT